MKKLVSLKGNTLTQGLTEHFGYLLPDTNWKPVLTTIMEQVHSVAIVDDTLELHFSKNRKLIATPGAKAGAYQAWPQSFQHIVEQHEYLDFSDGGWGLYLGESHNFEPDTTVGEAREYYNKNIPLLAPITNYSDWLVYHPDKKTTTGKPILCDYDHETCDFGKRITHSVGATFLMLLSQVLELGISFPSAPKIKTEDSTAHQEWWQALSPAWKNWLCEEFELEHDEIPSKKNIENLEEVSIWDENIVDPAPILQFSALKKLHLSNLGITDFSFIEQLINLEELTIRKDIEDLSPLKNLSKLKDLGLGKTKISDLSPLQNLTQLQDLELYKTAITNIDALSNCTQLVNLTLSDTQIQDLSALPQLENIYEISISRTKVTSLKPLCKFKKMKKLRIQGTPINLKEILSFLDAVPDCYLVCDYYEDPESAKTALLKLESIANFEQGYALFTFEILNSLFVKDWISKTETYNLLVGFVRFLPFAIKGDLQQKLLLLSLNILKSIHTEHKEIDTKEVEEKVLEYLLPAKLNDEVAYSIALYFTQQNNKENVMLFSKKAVKLGIEPSRFLADDNFAKYIDAAFKKVVFTIDFPDPKIDPKDWWNALSKDWQQSFLHEVYIESLFFDASLFSSINIKEAVNKTIALTEFRNRGVDLKNLHPLKYLTRLKKLRLMNGSYTSLEPLNELNHLEEVELTHKKNIQDLSPLIKLTKLKKIDFFQSEIPEVVVAILKKERPEIEIINYLKP